MRLRVSGTTDLRFGQVFLLPEIKRALVREYTSAEERLVDRYLGETESSIKSSRQALQEIVKHLYVQRLPKCLVICLDNNVKLNGDIYCEDFARFLNYGNLQIPPLKLFDRVMERVALQLPWWYSVYMGD